MFHVRVDLTKYESDVARIGDTDKAVGKILFYGDSLFTRWSERYGNRPLEEDIIGKDGTAAGQNHGIGGSSNEQLLYYYPRLVRPYHPRALVLKSHGNDAAAGYTPLEILCLQARILAWARQDFPDCRLYLCNAATTYRSRLIAPNQWSRQREEYNSLCEEFIVRNPDVTLLRLNNIAAFYECPEDVGTYRNIRRDLFIEDEVHPSQEGYDIYAAYFRDALADLL